MSIDRTGAHFRRLGTAASWTPADYTDGGTGTVILDAPGQDVLGGAGNATEYSVLYQATDFIGMTFGDTLTVNGVDYKVRTAVPVDDGNLMRATLARVDS